MTDGFYDPREMECKHCENTHKEICKLFALRRDLSDEEKFKNKTDAESIVSLIFKAKE